MPSMKSTNFGSRYLVDRLSEWDEIWQVDMGVLVVHQGQDWWTLAQGSLKILKGVKNFVTLFCTSFGLARRDEIWHIEGHWCIAGLKGFWWTLVRFSRSTNFWQWMSCTLLVGAWRNLAALGVWPFDIYSPNLVNFGPEVPQYHAATCISPSLMPLFCNLYFIIFMFAGGIFWLVSYSYILSS